jgi:anti-sigma-K factor RskA
MDCREIQKLVPVFLDGELEPSQQQRVETHLQTCAECRKEVQAVQKTWEMLGELDDIQPAPNYEARFWARISEQAPWHEKALNELRELFVNRRFIPALAAAGVILLVTFVTIYQYSQKPEKINLLAEFSDVDLDMVENFELVENYDLIHDIDFLSDLDIIDRLDEIDAS